MGTKHISATESIVRYGYDYCLCFSWSILLFWCFINRLHAMWYQILWYRNATDNNVQHVVEVHSARVTAEEDVAKNSEDLLEQLDGEYCVGCPSIYNFHSAKFTSAAEIVWSWFNKYLRGMNHQISQFCVKMSCYIMHSSSFFSWGAFFAVTSAQERESISGVLNVVRTHANTLETLREDHAGQATSIEHTTSKTFQQQYRVGWLGFYFVLGKSNRNMI